VLMMIIITSNRPEAQTTPDHLLLNFLLRNIDFIRSRPAVLGLQSSQHGSGCVNRRDLQARERGLLAKSCQERRSAKCSWQLSLLVADVLAFSYPTGRGTEGTEHLCLTASHKQKSG
jgi:hypothetical protein